MSQQLELAIAERDKGVARVKAKNADFVETMRGVARRLARNKADRIITADDLRDWYSHNQNIGSPSHFNVWGAVFCNNDDFEFVGYTKSVQKQGHGNIVRKWRLISA
jgi:hypothetical protein